MNCEDALELLSASLDGELNLAEQAQLETHLETCPHCRALLGELTAIHEACGALDAEVPDGLKEQIMEKLPRQTASKVIYWKRWAAAAAVLGLVVLGAWRMGMTTDSDLLIFANSNIGRNVPVTVEDSAAVATEDAPAEPETSGIMLADAVLYDPPGAASDVDETYGSLDSGAAIQATGGAVSTGPAAPQAIAKSSQKEDAVPVTGAAENGVVPFNTRSTSTADRDSGAVPEAAPETGEMDAPAASFERISELKDAAHLYCGVLTLAGYDFGGKYEARSVPGGLEYTLPTADFKALIEALDIPYDLRVTGDDISPEAPYGLVVVTGTQE